MLITVWRVGHLEVWRSWLYYGGKVAHAKGEPPDLKTGVVKQPRHDPWLLHINPPMDESAANR